MRNVNIDETKNRIIKRLMTGVKGFNERHRAVAGITTFFALLLIVVISFIFSCAGVVASVFGGSRSGVKKIIAVIAMLLLLLLIYLGAQRFDHSRVVDTQPLSETVDDLRSKNDAEKAITPNDIDRDNIAQDDNEDVTDESQDVDDEVIEDLQYENDNNSINDEATNKEIKQEDEITLSEKWDFSEIDLISFMKDHPDVVGWVYFEDGHISYPIVHSEDNEEYRILDYDKEESRYGAIFLDYRSSGDFTDANSIVYGHNMKDGSMFGTLRAYRQDPTYYNDHQYFQIITPDKTYRYLIFEYMDVPENYVLYDYVAEAALSFVADAEPIRIKSYMDSDIVVNKDSKVVTLSTCTRKDDLQFVVLGVLVEEITD